MRTAYNCYQTPDNLLSQEMVKRKAKKSVKKRSLSYIFDDVRNVITMWGIL